MPHSANCSCTVDACGYHQTDVLALSLPTIGNYLLRVQGTVRDLRQNKQVGVQSLKYLTIHCLGSYQSQN